MIRLTATKYYLSASTRAHIMATILEARIVSFLHLTNHQAILVGTESEVNFVQLSNQTGKRELMLPS